MGKQERPDRKKRTVMLFLIVKLCGEGIKIELPTCQTCKKPEKGFDYSGEPKREAIASQILQQDS